MSILRPGRFDITDKAAELMDLPKNAAVLEIGCGEGDTTEHLEKEYGYKMSAIDISLEMVRKAKEKGLKADIKYGDGEFLDEFTSFSFDAVIMECVLSLINIPDEALHEAYCVLKKGGRLFISDLYMKDPDPARVKAIKTEADRLARIPHEHKDECGDDCAEDHKKRFVDFRFEDRFIKEPLIKNIEDIGFKVTFWEDRSADLETYVAEAMMNGEDVSTTGKMSAGSCTADRKKDTGYFMMVAEKGD